RSDSTGPARAPEATRAAAPLGGAEPVRFRTPANSKYQSFGLLDLRQLLHPVQHGGRDFAVDLDQRNGVAALLDAAEMESRDVELGIAEQAGKGADKARLVLVGDVDHRLAEFGVDPDALDVDQPRLAVMVDRAGDRAL